MNFPHIRDISIFVRTCFYRHKNNFWLHIPAFIAGLLVPLIAVGITLQTISILTVGAQQTTQFSGATTDIQNNTQTTYLGRYFNPDTELSIFPTCVDIISRGWNNSIQEYRALFGYANKTDTPIILEKSNIPPGRRTWINPTPYIRSLDENAQIEELIQTTTLPQGLVEEGDILKQATYTPQNIDTWLAPQTDPNFWQWSVETPTKLQVGEVAYAFAVQGYSTEDLVWSASYQTQDGSIETIQTRANPQFLPTCEQYEQSMHSLVSKKLEQGQSIDNREVISAIIPTPPSLHTVCTTYESDGTYTSRLGYINPYDRDILAHSSTIFGTTAPSREVFHTHSMFDEKIVEQVGVDPSTFVGAILTGGSPEELTEIPDAAIDTFQKPISYLLPGYWSPAMMITGYPDEDIVWSFVYTTASNEQYTIQTRSNPTYAEPCEASTFENMLEETRAVTPPQDTIQSAVLPNSTDNVDGANSDTPTDQETSAQIESAQEELLGESASNTVETAPTTKPLSFAPYSLVSYSSVLASAQTTSSQPQSTNISQYSTVDEAISTQTDISGEVISLGGLDLYTYCKAQYGSEYIATTYQGDSSSNWVCRKEKVLTQGDWTQVCQSQYPENNISVGRYYEENDPSSIYCLDTLFFIEGGDIGGLDLLGYCRNIFDENSELELVENSVFGWACHRTFPIAMNNACHYLYGQTDSQGRGIVAYDENPQDSGGVECVVGVESNIAPNPITGDGNTANPGSGGNSVIVDSRTLSQIYEDDIRASSFEFEPELGYGFISNIASRAITTTIRDLNSVMHPSTNACNWAQTDLQSWNKLCLLGTSLSRTLYTMFSILANMLQGMVAGMGDYITGVLEGFQNIGETIELLNTLSRDVTINYANSIVQYMLVNTYRLAKQKDVFIYLMGNKLIEFYELDMFTRAFEFGRALGQFIPDVLFALLGFFTAGATWKAIAAKWATMIAKVADTASDLAKVGGIVGVLGKFLGTAIKLTSKIVVTLQIIKGKLVLIAQELIDQIAKWGDEALEAFAKLLPDEQMAKLRRYGAQVSACAVQSVAYTTSSAQFFYQPRAVTASAAIKLPCFRSLKDKASWIKKNLNNNRNRIEDFIINDNVKYTIDLDGKAHFNKDLNVYIDTPHVTRVLKNTNPNTGQVFWNPDADWVRAATDEDLEIIIANLN